MWNQHYRKVIFFVMICGSLSFFEKASLFSLNRLEAAENKSEQTKEELQETVIGKKKEVVEESEEQPNKTVLIAILARNKAHVLPRYLKCIQNLDYDKKLIHIYVKTDNNSDDTEVILKEWIKKNEKSYASIIYDDKNFAHSVESNPHDWTPARFKILAKIRNDSLQKAKEQRTDFYFVVDCDNFIAPFTLKDLVKQDKPIIAPVLRSIPNLDDNYSNYFCKCSEYGYYDDHPEQTAILHRKKVGVFKVEVVHCTYLIKTDYIDELSYTDGTNDFEFVIFSRVARKNGIDQYVINEKEYGVQIHFGGFVTLEEEKRLILPFLTLP